MSEQTFGRLFKKIRGDYGRTLSELAHILGMSVSMISDIENGRRRALTPALIEALCKELGITEEERRALINAGAKDRKTFEIKTSENDGNNFNEFAFTLARYSEEGNDFSDVNWEEWTTQLLEKMKGEKKNE